MRAWSIEAAAFAAALFVTASSPEVARASSCCGAGHSIALRLADAETAALLSSVRGAARVGAWASSRDFTAPGDGDFDREIRGEIAWLMRVHRRADIGVTVPLLYTFRRAGDLASSGGGVGDITASGRLRLTSPSASVWIPGISLTFAALLPTGRAPQSSDDLLAADATGLGAAELRPGITLEKTWGDGWLATASVSVGWRTAFTAPGGIDIHLAPRWQAVLAAGPSWTSGLSLAAGLIYEREGGPAIDAIVDPDATRERTSALLFAAYDADARWTLVASSQIDVPITGLGRNESASVALAIGLRRAWSFHD